ncbi:hypothetical protein DM860_000706 [Cuscuta australis]|uniref:CRM domain-containing protein n=1 Tax=Cuscuta australis TaxID=267555 RepID=A0A328CX23_9ASTE|nr:hypothetical protein DM860_000706 [Cuscuta australis]
MFAIYRNSRRQCSISISNISKICSFLVAGDRSLLYLERKTLSTHVIGPALWSCFQPLKFFPAFSYDFHRSFSTYQKRVDAKQNDVSFVLKTDKDVVRFCVGEDKENDGSLGKAKKTAKKFKMSKRAKVNELRFYRLKAKKKMKSPNPEVRIRYKLDKAKRKEVWLIEKLRKFEVLNAVAEPHDPEILTEDDRFYLKRIGEKKKNYVLVGRRGVFGGVVLNMHLHWKNHETVKVVCKPCKPGQVHEYAAELGRLSQGIVIGINPDNSIIFYRGRNYIQPDVLSPRDTLSKAKALEKYKFGQSLDHTSQFIEKLEKELEEYHKYLAKKRERDALTSLDANV